MMGETEVKVETFSSPCLAPSSQTNEKVPYHGAEELNAAVRRMIFETPDGALKPMSSNLMMKTLISEGMKEGMASKLNSQIRKGAPLHVAWKSAFSTGKFIQKTGRGAGSRKKRTHELMVYLLTSTCLANQTLFFSFPPILFV